MPVGCPLVPTSRSTGPGSDSKDALGGDTRCQLTSSGYRLPPETGDRVQVLDVGNPQGLPVYVHAKARSGGGSDHRTAILEPRATATDVRLQWGEQIPDTTQSNERGTV